MCNETKEAMYELSEAIYKAVIKPHKKGKQLEMFSEVPSIKLTVIWKLMEERGYLHYDGLPF
jgi:hypothetical protein